MTVLSKGPGTLVACAEELWLKAAAASIDYLCRSDSLLFGADGQGKDRLKEGNGPCSHLTSKMKAGQKPLELSEHCFSVHRNFLGFENARELVI